MELRDKVKRLQLMLLSELLIIARDDIKKAVEQYGVKLQMDAWIRTPFNGCEACLAGATVIGMFDELPDSTKVAMSWDKMIAIVQHKTPDNECIEVITHYTRFLNHLRSGQLSDALYIYRRSLSAHPNTIRYVDHQLIEMWKHTKESNRTGFGLFGRVHPNDALVYLNHLIEMFKQYEERNNIPSYLN